MPVNDAALITARFDDYHRFEPDHGRVYYRGAVLLTGPGVDAVAEIDDDGEVARLDGDYPPDAEADLTALAVDAVIDSRMAA